LVEESSKKRRDVDIKTSIIQYGAIGALNFALGPFFMVIIILFFVPRVIQGTMSIGTLLVFFEYSRQLFEPIMAIAENIRGIQQAFVSVDRIFSILDLETEVPQRNQSLPQVYPQQLYQTQLLGEPSPIPPGSAITVPARADTDAVAAPGLAVTTGSAVTTRFVAAPEIEFSHVWFAYSGEDWILQDVSFHIPRGSTTALVGPSGSGKTTTIGLLCGFYKPQRGRILINGTDLADLDLQVWRSSIGLVLQDVYLFPGSVLENIRLYNDDISEQRVWEALQTVHAADLVEGLPAGIYSELRERGGNVSSGEKQLLSFARALAINPSLIILDEATASVDIRTERKIHESMEQLVSGRTALIVAHRLSSIQKADQILYFTDGEIAARGKHQELLTRFAPYAELVRLQFLDRKEEL
ncbi:MAG: ABC transporter ATP-binding protein, partial [Termitinemataceae bacterium]